MAKKLTLKTDSFMPIFLSLAALLFISVTVYSTLNPKQLFNASAARRCTDSDGGYDPFVQGTINGPRLTTKAKPVDYCVAGNTKVVEYGCDSANGWLYGTAVNGLYSNSIDCQGIDSQIPACQNGACFFPSPPPGYSCSKSDNGDIYTKGHLTSSVQGVCFDNVGQCLTDIYDFCATYPDHNMIEFTCNRPDPYAKSWGMHGNVYENAINCPKGCSNGACIK